MEEDYEYYLDRELNKDPLADDSDEYEKDSIYDDINYTFDTIKRTRRGKCGEIFIKEDDLFSFLCTLCENPFDQIEQFYLHVKSKHISLKHNDNTSTRTKYNIGETLNKPNQKEDELKSSVDLVQSVKTENSKIEKNEDTPVANFNEDGGTDNGNDIDNMFDLVQNVKKEDTRIELSKEKNGKPHLKEELCKDSDTDGDYEINKNSSPSLKLHTKELNNVEKQTHCNDKQKYSCNSCQRDYLSKKSLRRHMFMKHTPSSDIPNDFKCNFCGKHFGDRRRKKEHENVHTGEKPFQCQFCKECFRTKQMCSTHEKTHSSNIEKCNEDNLTTEESVETKTLLHKSTENLNQKTFKSEDLINQVLNDEKKDSKIEINEITDTNNSNEDDGTDDDNDKDYKFDTDSLSSLDIDSKKCDNAGKDILRNEKMKYTCNECEKGYFEKNSLRRHIFMKHTPFSDIPDELKCNICGKHFGDKKRKKEHESIHTGEKPFQCQFCKECFRTKWKCSVHEKNHTSNLDSTNGSTEDPSKITAFQCIHCGKSFKCKTNLVNHELIHTGERPFSCETCGKSFRTKRLLESHKDTHSSERQYKCQLCNMRFRIKSNLYAHIYRHKNEKKHKCPYCEKAFFAKRERNEHVTIHTNEKPFQCKKCGEQFRSRSTLRIHVKKHLGIRPFKCEHCDKTFILQSYLKNHLAVHTGAKPFTCSICNESFSRRSELSNHKKIYHQHREDIQQLSVFENGSNG